MAGAGLAGAGLAGAGLAGVTRAVAAVRPSAKPLHPRGVVVEARLTRLGGKAGGGVPWLGQPRSEAVTLRISRAVGLPPGWPDVHGLALRATHAGAPVDVLFATTGRRPLGRFLLTPTRRLRHHCLTTLLPYRGPDGPLMLAAFAESEGHFTLCWATPLGRWTRFGHLVVQPVAASDQPLWFDPVRHPPPGLRNYGWVQELRAPAYRAARRQRGLAV